MANTNTTYEKLKSLMLAQSAKMRELNRVIPVSGTRYDLPLDGREINIVYFKADKKNAPLVLGFHGGGFLFGGNALNDAMWSAVRDTLGVNVASIDYRKSPDHSSTDAIMDGYDAAVYLKAHAEAFGFDPDQISVMGASAGANLAAGLCIYAGQNNPGLILNQILIYPLVDNVTPNEEKKDGHLSAPPDQIFRDLHCTNEQAKTSIVSPIFASDAELAVLPNTVICTADIDSLKDEGLRYADRLKENGVPTSLMICAGMPHIFFEVGFGEISEEELRSYSPELQELVKNGEAHRASVEALEFAAKHFRKLEKIILVDLNDQEIGGEEKLRTHEKSLLHRAFSVFIVNGDQMLIQKRSLTKYHSGGLWANACCSHPRVGETLEEAVHRRLPEEAGFDCPLKEVFSFTYRTTFSNGLTEYEYDHVFLGEYCGEVNMNPEEASECRWISFADLKKEMLETPERFCSWFMIAAPKVMQIVEGNR